MTSFEAGVAREQTRNALFGTVAQQRKIHRYTVLERIGAGAMGVVYAAYDPDLDRRVAIKLLRTPDTSAASPARDRMLAEARALARLAHANVVAVFEVGVWGNADEAIFVAMEFVHGRTLRAWREDTRPDWRAVLLAYVQAGRGLAAAHRAGLVHRDFKPDNAMIDDDGRVRVMDFGLARDEAGILERTTSDPASSVTRPSLGASKLTRSGAIMGTPAYMAPEQLAGLPADVRSDQWAFCVALYEALWGRRPYEAESIAALAAVVLDGDPPREPPDSAGVPRPIRAAILRGLAAAPEQRWPSLDALVDALARAQIGADRRRQFAGATVLVAVAAVVLAAHDGVAPGDQARDCHGFDVHAARAWDAANRRAVDEAVAGATEELGVGLIRDLDSHSEDLRAARGSACAERDVDVAVGSLQCLERLERELAGTVELLSRSTASTLGSASMAVAELEAPNHCGAAGPSEIDEDPEVAGLLAQARVSMRSGRVADAYATATLACARLAGHTASVQWARCQLALGDAMVTLGKYEDASIVLEEAYVAATALDRTSLSVRAAELAARVATLVNHPQQAQRWLGNLRAAGERSQDAAAQVAIANVEAELLGSEQRYAEAIAVHDALRNSGALDRVSTSRRINVHLRAARLRGRTGDATGSERELDLAAELASHLPESHALVGAVHALHAQHLGRVGRLEDAVAEYRIVLELAARYRGPDDPIAADSGGAIAEYLLELGRLDEAFVVADENVRRAELAAANTTTLPNALLARGQIHFAAGRFAAAERDGAAALTLAESRHDGAEVVAAAWSLLANARRELGRPDEARAHAELAIAGFTRTLGAGHPETLNASMILAQLESDRGDLEQAIALTMRVRDGFVTAGGPDHPDVAFGSYNLGGYLERAGRLELALVEFERSLAIWRAALGDANANTREAEVAVGRIRLAMSR